MAWLSERKAAEDRPVVRQCHVYYVKTVDDDRVVMYYHPVQSVTTAMSWLTNKLLQATIVQQ